MNPAATDFEIFNIPATFAQDGALLDVRWKTLMRETHPDRFVSQGAAAQRVAMQWSVRINEAYQRLRDPLKRAAYLCALHGAAVDAQSNTAMPQDFLQQQLQWREALDEAGDAGALNALRGEVDAARCRALSSLDWLIDEQGDYAQAAGQVRALMFVERLAQAIQTKAEQLGQ